MKKSALFIFLGLTIILLTFSACSGSSQKVVWKIGNADDSPSEFALAPGGYEAFLENDFGFEDRAFIWDIQR
jgi:hypothetical protein